MLIALAVLVMGSAAAGVAWFLLGRSDSTASGTSRQAAPIRFQHVTAETPGSCTSGGTPSADGSACYQLGDGMTVTQARNIRVVGPDSDNPAWRIEIDLRSPDAQAFAELTRKTSTEAPGSPQRRVAIVVGGQVVSAPEVQSTIPGGQVQISGNYTKQSAEQLFHQMTG
jgi:preprotein translocase subunit SecD